MTEVAQETPVEIAASADRKEDDDVFGPDVSEGTTKSESTKKSGMSRRAKKVSKVASESQQADKKGQKKKTSKSSVRESLSADAMEIISKIQQRQTDAPKAGRVSVADLMTSYREKEANTSIMQRLLQKPLTAVNVLATAASERAAVPGFPRAADNATQGVLPEILMNALNIGQNAEVRRGNRSPNHHSRPTAEERVLPDRLPPWISLSPMYPLEEKYIHSQQRMNTFGPRRPDNRPDRSYPQHGRHESNSGPGKTSGNSMARKPFFMPYMSGDMVSRGLAAKDLIKGSLRVNQRNFEESYIDNPEGNDQMDLLIYGLQDRNRALHGDVVVVRIKQRNQWIVRENLYNAWRHNELKATCDDDGKPLTVPPVPVPKEEGVVELVLGGTAEVKIKQEELCKVVPVSENAKYGREEMILMGAQAEISRRSKQAGGDHQIPLNASLNPHLEEMITNLSLKRIELQDLGLVTPSTKIQPKRPIGQKKGALRTVAEMPDEDWGMPDCCLQKTAEVVFIAEQKNCRAAMGQLKVMNDNNKNWALFSPTDSRMPRMMIPGEQVPKGFFDRPQDFLKFVFVARLVEWQAANQFARGRLERSLGVAGDPDVETEGLLFSNNVDAREFPPSSLQSLPDTATEAWTIPQDELTGRRDFREETVFTIDPKTARDLDDALHIKYCEDVDGKGKSGWEVGVHIADVTYFLTEGTELDEWAAQRATSVYLVHKVIPMLPRVLCEELCSLNPGVDRLTFSVIWKIDDEGTIYSEEFVRSVIRSKVKLAYEHAQDFIEHPDKEFAVNELPEIFDDISVATIKEKVLHLNNIALKLRGQRVQNGALRLDQPKLKFALDDAGKLPMGVAVYEIKDANRLVEEYMLLANMAVARRIEEHYPSTAMLRRHPAPKQKVMREVLEICQKIGFPLDATSSGLLSSSLNKYMGDTTLMRSINQVLSMLMMKPMQLAQYFCVGTMENKSDYAHYALACPYYTHFTSPIRRYPDVMVHRFLAASLKYTQPPNMSIQEIQKLAEHCNDKKLSAKTVSEGSDEIFFGLFVKACGPLNERAVVINVLDASFDVLVFKYGVIKRVYLNKLNMAREHIHVEGPPSKLVLFWNDKDHGVLEQTIQMCTVVDVELSVESTNEPSVKYKAVIKPSTPKTLRELMLKGETLDEGTTRIPDVRPLGDLCND